LLSARRFARFFIGFCFVVFFAFFAVTMRFSVRCDPA